MGIVGKLEVEIDIKSSGDVFHELFGHKAPHVSKYTPDKIHACEIHEGEFGKPGSIVHYGYTLGEKKCVAKMVLEVVDPEKKMVKGKATEGDPLEEYKSYAVTCHVIPKGEISRVIWCLEFEKIHDDGPYPTKEADFFVAVTRDIESQCLKA